MKILHINSYFSTSKFYKNLYDAQVAKGIDITVFVPIYNKFNYFLPDSGNYTVYSRNYQYIDRFFFQIKQFKILKDVENKFKIPDFSTIHAHSLFTNGFVAYQLYKKYNIPYIVAVRNTDVNLFFKYMFHLRKIGIEIMKSASKIIFLSEGYKDQVLREFVPYEYCKLMKEKSVIIPNGIDGYWLKNKGRVRKKMNSNNLNLIQVGDINKNKNVLQTINAIEILRKKGYNIKLDIVGKIKNNNIFRKLTAKKFVHYKGFVSKNELINYYRENDIFILPSKHETFGIVYLEAMSQGLPLIYTRDQGFDKLFKEGEVGFSVDYDDPIEMAECILAIIDNYEEMSKNCIESVDNFDWEHINKQYIEVYNMV